MSIAQYAKNHQLTSGGVFSAECVHADGTIHLSKIDLNKHLGIVNGSLEWGKTNYTSSDIIDMKLEGTCLKVTLKDKDGHRVTKTDIAKFIFNDNGYLKYIPGGVAPAAPCTTQKAGTATATACHVQPKTDSQPPYTSGAAANGGIGITDPALNGNIEAASFTVASDRHNNRCRIAYKTYMDEKITLAEVECRDGEWRMATQIDTYVAAMVGHNFALTYDPSDYNGRSLFFTEENGDGYIYGQTYNPKTCIWDPPATLKAAKRGRDDGYKAHRFSKFATTHYHDGASPYIFLYYVDENNGLQEIIGTAATGSHKLHYSWSRGELLEENVPANAYFAVQQNGKETHILYRDGDRHLCLKTGTRVANCKGKATWGDKIILLKSHKLVKDSPLAIATRDGYTAAMTIFYLNSVGRCKTVYALDYSPGAVSQCKPRSVGKLEPNSVLGAASFEVSAASKKPDVRLFSVSNLDGDNILLERVQKKVVYSEEGERHCHAHRLGRSAWVINGGVVETDVEHILPRVETDFE